MSMEIWDLYSADGNKLNRTAKRGQFSLKPGEYHLVVHIWIISPDGKFLIQRRSDDKKLMPGEWAATGGAAVSGENSFCAARRELFEELGISSTEETLKKLIRIRRRNSLVDVWLIGNNTPAEELTLQKSEVAEVKWVTRDELKRMIENGDYHNYGKEYFNTVFAKIDEQIGATV